MSTCKAHLVFLFFSKEGTFDDSRRPGGHKIITSHGFVRVQLWASDKTHDPTTQIYVVGAEEEEG